MADVKGLGKIVEIESDFFTQLQKLRKGGARLISVRNEAFARLYTKGKENIGKSYGTGTRTSSGFAFAKGQLPIFRVESGLTERLARLMVEANRKGSNFHTDSTRDYEELLKQAEKDKDKEPERRNVIVLPSRTPMVISDKQNWEVYKSIFKDQATPYFEFYGPITIGPLEVEIIDSKWAKWANGGTLLTAVYFASLDDESFLGERFHTVNYKARGVIERVERV